MVGTAPFHQSGFCEIDLRAEGKNAHRHARADGAEYPMPAIVREVVSPEKFSFTNSALDTQGNRQLEGSTTVTFDDEGGKTRMTVHSSATGSGPIAKQMLDGMGRRLGAELERLEALVIKK